jgi:hypothetical protein
MSCGLVVGGHEESREELKLARTSQRLSAFMFFLSRRSKSTIIFRITFCEVFILSSISKLFSQLKLEQ